MKSILPHDLGQDWNTRVRNRQLAKTQLKALGTPRKPPQPRGVRVVIQDGTPTVVWDPPLRSKGAQINGYQVYQTSDTKPAQTIPNKGTTQTAVNIPSGKTRNIYISTVNDQGESRKIHVRGFNPA